MAKTVEVLGRHCIICNKFWVAAHPHDLNGFCPECHEALTELINMQKETDKQKDTENDDWTTVDCIQMGR